METGIELIRENLSSHTKGRKWSEDVENRVLRRTFGPKKEEVAGDLRRLHNEELHNLYASPNIIRVIKFRRMRWTGHVALMGIRNVYKILVGKPEGMRPLGRPTRRWEDNIRMDFREIGWEGMDWIHLTQDRGPVAGCCEPGDEPSGSITGVAFFH
jgi:hypothetical protein